MTRIWGAFARIPVPAVAALLVVGGALMPLHDLAIAHVRATGAEEWPQWVARLTVMWYWAFLPMAALALWARRRNEQGRLGRFGAWLNLVGGPAQYAVVTMAALVWQVLLGHGDLPVAFMVIEPLGYLVVPGIAAAGIAMLRDRGTARWQGALLVGLAVAVAVWTLGLRRGRTMDAVMKDLARSVSGIAMILLVIAAGGALSQVLRDAGVAQWVSERATGLRWNPLVVAFAIAALLRLAVGSATVAGMTTAGLLAPTVAASGVRPELMVLATGAGSLMFSHFNDTGFWMFKEYFGLTVRETFATWSVMEIIVGLVGLAAALGLHALL